MTEESVPIAYTALSSGVPVQDRDGQSFGTVRRVLAVEDMDVFDGIVIDTEAGVRFVDAPQVDRIFTTHVTTTLTAEQAAALPEPSNDGLKRIRPGDRVGRSFLGRFFRR